jgi:hypothetical protein
MSSELMSSTDELLAPENVQELQMRAAQYEHPRDYVNHLLAKYSTQPVYAQTIHVAGHMIEPFTNSSDVRKLRSMRAAFLAGNLLATEVVDIFGGEELLSVLPQVRLHIQVPRKGLPPDETQLFASAQLLQQGTDMYNVATVFHPLIDGWEYKLAHRKQQESLRAGFGFMLSVGSHAIDLWASTTLSNAVEQGVDWEASMQQLLEHEAHDD